MLRQIGWISMVIVLLPALAGCIGRKAKFKPAQLNPAAAAQKAMELYDADANGMLDQKELEKCGGILGALSLYDTNEDKKVSQQEIQDRLQKYVEKSQPWMAWSVVVLYENRPLENADVRFVPEPFLGDAILPAWGVTDQTGRCDLAPDASQAPSGLDVGFGVQPGIYKVEIRHDSVPIPANYNDQTKLGVEISPIEMQTLQETVIRISRR